MLTFGEILIRFTPKNFDLFANNNELEYFFGGSEINIAATLTGLGIKTKLFSAVPQNDMSTKIIRYLKGIGIDTERVIQRGEKIGYYFVERSVGPRQSSVIYDRKHSSFSQLTLEDVDTNVLLDEIQWVHFSGSTAAVNESVREILKELLIEAKKREIFVSMDLNFRSKMWSAESAKQCMTALAPYVDVCFGIEPIMLHDQDVKMFNREEAGKEEIQKRMEDLKQKFGFQYIFHTVRKNDEQNNNIYYAYGLAEHFEESAVMKTYMVERIGSGDAFVSGIIYSLIKNYSLKEALDFGTASATLKCTVKGDHMIPNVQEIMNVMNKTNSIDR